MSTGKHAFLIIGASTPQTVADFKVAFDRYGEKLTLFIEADLNTYIKATVGNSPNVYSIPTNLRAPYQYRPGVPGEASKPIVLGDVELDSFIAFMECQRMISQSVMAILDFARINGIPTYFPIVGRKQRPTHIQVLPGCDKVGALPPDEGPRASHPGSDQELSNLALEVLVKPAFQQEGLDLHELLMRCTDHNASYLADVLAVIVAAEMTEEDTVWERWNLTSCEVLEDGTHSKVIFDDKAATDAAKNIPYCKATFESNTAGQFFSMDSTSDKFDPEMFKKIVHDMMHALKNKTLKPVWDTCYVAHDAFALDVDDLPAIELLKLITKHLTEIPNWREASAK